MDSSPHPPRAAPLAGFRLVLPLLSLLAAGCASHSLDLGLVRASLVAGDIPQAVQQFEARGGKESNLLYLLEKGYMMRLAGRFDESNLAFEAAEQRADDLYTRSISREALSFLTTDLAGPYRGMPYELQLVQYYRALNYLDLGKPEEALVEARKANFKLTQYAEKMQDDKALRQDPFLQYFTGILYESQGEANDAVVSLRDAAHLYDRYEGEYSLRSPPWLAEDYYAAARYLGLHDEVGSLESRDSTLAARSARHDDDNLVVFLESGFVPYREAVDITFPVYKVEGEKDKARADSLCSEAYYVDKFGNDVYAWRADRVKLDHVLRFTFPALVDVPSPVRGCEVVLPGGEVIRAAPALDLRTVARSEFQDRLPGILLKTLARAVAKEGARRSAKKESDVFGFLVNVAGVATEQADTRGWIFLPGRIDLVKAKVPAGTSKIKARFLDTKGATLEEWDVQVQVADGGTRFVSVRSFK